MKTFSRRYLAYTDGSFCRMSKIDDSLDAYTDVDLAHMKALRRSNDDGPRESARHSFFGGG